MKIDELYALLRRRGVLWPSAEIYGSAAGLFDYGPLGHALKRRIEAAWESWFLGLSEDYYRIEPAELLPEAVVRASGHLEGFTDPEVSCAHCHAAFRAETLLEKIRPNGIDGLSAAEIGQLLTDNGVRCPNCGERALEIPRPFNLMFAVDWGPTGKERTYLAPETAQASYLAFPRMWDVGRHALPLGIAVVGHAYRNEIAPRQVLFRMRSFTQAELQIFFDPQRFPLPFETVRDERLPVLRAAERERGLSSPRTVTAAELVADGLPEFYAFHLAWQFRFFRDVLGYPAERLRLFEKNDAERAFYNRIQFDVEANLESLGGFREVGALHYRGDYDLARHSAGTGKEISVTLGDGRKLVPHVLELTFGVDRNLWAIADLGLSTEGERTLWRVPTYLAPLPVAVLPLIAKAHGTAARAVAAELRAAGVDAWYDESGAIGRRYARMDEVGTPWCVTIDGETIDPAHPHHGTVTLRNRDDRTQVRVPTRELASRIQAVRRLPRPLLPEPSSATPAGA
ncbi:MAG TPA: glycine--tRNA ligase [Thermoplasmata archaeon]|nr:glycine--tRNA ligase [Thermoplasmata archaeon]